MHVIAAKAVCFKGSFDNDFKVYTKSNKQCKNII